MSLFGKHCNCQETITKAALTLNEKLEFVKDLESQLVKRIERIDDVELRLDKRLDARLSELSFIKGIVDRLNELQIK